MALLLQKATAFFLTFKVVKVLLLRFQRANTLCYSSTQGIETCKIEDISHLQRSFSGSVFHLHTVLRDGLSLEMSPISRLVHLHDFIFYNLSGTYYRVSKMEVPYSRQLLWLFFPYDHMGFFWWILWLKLVHFVISNQICENLKKNFSPILWIIHRGDPYKVVKFITSFLKNYSR